MNIKTAVVVGGTGHIGSRIVRLLRDRHYDVVCIAKSPISSLPYESGVDYAYADMTRLTQIEECAYSITNTHNSVDLLINVIGRNINGLLADIDENMWQEVMDANLKSTFFICRTFSEYMLKDKGGCIINFASTAGIRGLPQSPHYIAAKAGVIALSEFFAKAYAPKIRVNCIAPGFVLTENHLPENYANYDKAISHIPLRQMSSTDEIAEAVLFLANSPTITGHTLVVDGGLIL